MRLTWLADVLRGAGLKVREVPGWKDRGKDLAAVEGIVWHHTATGPSWTPDRVDQLLTVGRSDLPGPLSQLGLDRDGTFVVVAAGRANHNGYGQWGNQSIGIEAYNNGVGEPWPAVQIDAYDRGTAAVAAHLKLTAAQVKGHRETDPGRKIDPAGIDMDQARQRIAHLITYRPPAKPPTPAPEEHDDMGTAYRDPRDGKVWIVTPAGRWHVPNRSHLDELVFVGLVKPFDGQPAKWPAGSVAVLDRIPVLEHKG